MFLSQVSFKKMKDCIFVASIKVNELGIKPLRTKYVSTEKMLKEKRILKNICRIR